jgi:chromosome condensin MukBEF MukE localization factor
LDGLQRNKVGSILRRLDVITPIFFSDNDRATLRIVESVARNGSIRERHATDAQTERHHVAQISSRLAGHGAIRAFQLPC